MVLYVDAGPSSVITLQDENIHQIQLSNLSHDEKILVFIEFQFLKL